MKVLLIGSGGREHAMALSIKKSKLCTELVCAPGNPGMAKLGSCIEIDVGNPKEIAKLAKEQAVDFTVIGPEVPLVAGVVDAFQKQGMKIFGPTAAAAKLEGSKAFSKEFMKRHSVPTAGYETFTDLQKAKDYLNERSAPIVVKASGLAAGKGAIICQTKEEALQAVESMLGENAVFGESGKTVVIEEFMKGEEASIFAVCDGKDYLLLAPAQDHKRIFDNDKGPNTGGMGAYAPAPIITGDMMDIIKETIIEPTLRGMAEEGNPYTGILFLGIMVTKEGPKLVEYNCRLGDPETQAVLAVYGGDLLDLFYKAAMGKIKELAKINHQGYAAVVVMASEGYPGEYKSGVSISGISEVEKTSALLLHAGTRIQDYELQTAGGRVFGVVGKGTTLKAALDVAYSGVKKIKFAGAHYRSDIGKKGLAKLK
ncbi:MAG: phosphoribosylamine--glycine ligase [Fibromonadaceae bacterium]|jgi:phosphoribosylamine--glycine ligase|nr:phosphoribosylamine--glycine ligase [Fibromonadaceae bacterium]